MRKINVTLRSSATGCDGKSRFAKQSAMMNANVSFSSQKMQIAYIVKGYPRMSEVFISNEIYQLERLGLDITIFSVKKSEDSKTHKSVEEIKAPVTYLPAVSSLSKNKFYQWLRCNFSKFSRSHAQLLKRKPIRYVRTLVKALSMCVRYRSGSFFQPKKVFVKEFLQAGYIASEALKMQRIGHFHAHFCHGSTTIAMFASQLTGIPFSFTAHAKDIYLKKLNPGDLLHLKLEKAQFALTCTGANKTYLETIATNGTPIHLVYHGLNTSLFKPAKTATASKLPLILSIGRFVKKKGFEHLVKACAILIERGFSFRTLIIGEDGEQTSVVQQLIHDHNLSEVISLQHALTQEELQEVYSSASLFVLPCQIVENGDRDGIPNVLAEAMANKLPVVSTNISGIPELVTDSVDGLLVEQKDARALANAIANLLRDEALRNQLGNAAREKICRIFDSRKNTIKIRNLFLNTMHH